MAGVSLFSRFQQAQEEDDASNRYNALNRLQPEAAGAISANEPLEEIATPALPLLSLPHYLAQAVVSLPMSPDRMEDRLKNLKQACLYEQSFLERLSRLGVLSKGDEALLESLMELSSSHSGDSPPDLPPSVPRDVKISRFKALQAAKDQQTQYLALQQRRVRLGLSETDDFEGHDAESLQRQLFLQRVTELDKAQAFEDWSETLREIPLVHRMVQHNKQREGEDRHRGVSSSNGPTVAAGDIRQRQAQQPSQGLKVTHISHDPTTGQLLFKKEQVKANVFKPGWNQPTMSLDELAEREVAQAKARDEAQSRAEASRASQPRRYEQLVKDGLDDDDDLVDASAPLDRAWDDFKDANPRGSGNKRGDVGDRNF